jgi:ATP-dependent RNA helicase DeaD
LADFTVLGVSHPLVQRLEELNITHPTEIQEKTIPILLSKEVDLIGQAHTGTGKTVAFGIPLLEKIKEGQVLPQALIMVPTRELGAQIAESLISYAEKMENITIERILGGSSLKSNIKAMNRPTDIVVATPGRIIDLLERNAIDLSEINYVVLDEADEMLNKGFKDSIIQILKKTKPNHSTWLFSATMPTSIKSLVNDHLKKGFEQVKIKDTEEVKGQISHEYIVVDPIEKLETLTHFLNEHDGERGIIFCRTKAGVNKLHKQMAVNRFSSGAVHGDLPQGLRDKVMAQFREGNIKLLIASDVVARGIDIKGISFVINYQFPDSAEFYTHRSGRTGRAGSNGVSLSILFKDELEKFKEIEEELAIDFQKIEKPSEYDLIANNVVTWAKRIAKVKPQVNDVAMREKVFNTLKNFSKEELLDRLITNELLGAIPHQIKNK